MIFLDQLHDQHIANLPHNGDCVRMNRSEINLIIHVFMVSNLLWDFDFSRYTMNHETVCVYDIICVYKYMCVYVYCIFFTNTSNDIYNHIHKYTLM